jgi:ATP-dependent NAD(P)H-hydrate dehydratase
MVVRPTVPLAALRGLVPPLAETNYKGSSGKVGVLGGCFEYTGAPFYAALSALKLGADLSHVFCDEQAAVPIKGYSPELIVHGCLRSGALEQASAQADEVCKWFPALSALVVGPGLGRDETLQAVAATVIQRAISASLPCVIDADGLRLVLEKPSVVAGARWVVLTPNKPEYARLVAALAPEPAAADGAADDEARFCSIARTLGGPTIVRKGRTDLLADGSGELLLECTEAGCLKRCGGQGDVLAGSIATMLAWAKAGDDKHRLPADLPAPPPMLAAYSACMLTRRFARAAFTKHKRSMTAPDLIEEIGETFEAFCPAEVDVS